MKKITAGTILLVTLSAFFTYSCSTKWVYVGNLGTSSWLSYYIDPENKVFNEDMVTFWWKEENSLNASTIRSRSTIDCCNNTVKHHEFFVYNSSGDILTSESFENSRPWTRIVPDSMLDKMRSIMCNKDNKSQESFKNLQ
jgi:hypothetical protein